eukprot:Skav200900  [mRNA]  locus=scaffold1581:218246:219950:+ [translate_table: standard]
MLLPRAGALEETTTSSIGEPEDSERSCLLQKKDFAASLQPSEIGENLCNEGEICSCESNPSNPSEFLQDRLLSDCIQNCEGKAGFTWRTYGAANSQCWCCDELEIDIHTLDDNTPEDFWKEYAVSDNRFVDGELKTGRRDFSELGMLQTSKPVQPPKDSWQSLGGSEQAALYLEMDQAEAAPVTLMSTPCAGEAEVAAKEICSKHLGDVEHSNDKDQSLFQDCVYDLCHGADETVAELAAELRDSTRAI